MALIKAKPTSPGRRFVVSVKTPDLHKGKPYTALLEIRGPCSCHSVQVPVCVPGCCTEPPSVVCRRGLFGRSVTEFTWCCGYRVRIVLTRGNKIVVHTYGA